MLTVLLWHVLNIDVKVVKNRDVDGALAARPEHPPASRPEGHHKCDVDGVPAASPAHPPAASPEPRRDGHHKCDV